jgi:hypothetical protein
MAGDLPLGCACGALRATARGVSARRGQRVVCYCDDCQAFARWTGRAGDVLDEYGGSEIFQTSPARFEIAAAADRLACIQLTPRGLVRWYAACCGTPIGNTLATRQVPFVGLVLGKADAGSRDALLGPIRARGHARFAKGTPPDAHPSFPPSAIARVFWIATAARLRGDHRRNPFFDRVSGAPVAAPRVLGADELAALRRTV